MYSSQGCYIAGTGGGICRVESHRLSAPGQNNQGPSWSTSPLGVIVAPIFPVLSLPLVGVVLPGLYT